MNLYENIQRIKEMMGILIESVKDVESILSSGSKGSEVEIIQDILGIYKDGKFGPQTKKCVQEFQNKVSIKDDGIVGDETKTKLKKLEDNEIEWETPEFCKTLENFKSYNSDSDSKTDEYDPSKKSEGKKLPPNIQKLIDKLKKDYGVIITQSHIDKEYAQEGDIRPDAGGVNSDAEKQIKKLISDCKKEFPDVRFPNGIVSGYRSYDKQVDNFGTKVKNNKRSIEDVQASNCLPGFSQHHTGKAFDIFSTDTSWWKKNSIVKNWVANNCKKYGFEVTYKTKGVLRIAEPWHLYYYK